MPKGITSESKWRAAKRIARQQGKQNDWDFIMTIYRRLGGTFKCDMLDLIQLNCNKKNYKRCKKTNSSNVFLKEQDGSDSSKSDRL